MSTPHLRNCPKVNCNQKNDCCPFRKIVIPAVMGDDSEDSPSAPENGAYRNALVEYEANGAMYIYASDGIYTKISMVAGDHGAATVAYVDSQDAAVLSNAKQYTDAKANTTIFYCFNTIPGNGEYLRLFNDIQYHEQTTYAEFEAAILKGDVLIRSAYDGPTSLWFFPVVDAMVETGQFVYFTVTGGGDSPIIYATYEWNNGEPEPGRGTVSSIATVARTGNYNDLTNKPTIPAAQVNSDWNAVSGKAQILNKPSLATVATTGSYNDLVDRPPTPTGQVQSDWTQLNSAEPDFIKHKPALSAVAISGSYTDLLNQPTLSTVAISGNYNDLNNKPTLATVATSGSYDDLSNKPTIPAAQVNSDWNASSGKAQILNKPTVPVITMTNTDPGEGSTLAANTFIGVYI